MNKGLQTARNYIATTPKDDAKQRFVFYTKKKNNIHKRKNSKPNSMKYEDFQRLAVNTLFRH